MNLVATCKGNDPTPEWQCQQESPIELIDFLANLFIVFLAGVNWIWSKLKTCRHLCKLYTPTSEYQLWLKVTAKGLIPYFLVKTCAWKKLSLPPDIGSTQS